MRRIISYFLTLVSTLTFISCERDANVKLPDTAPKPVLVCFISPQDSIIKVMLTNSRQIYTTQKGNYPYIIKNADVKISINGTSATIPFINDSLGYQLSTKFFSIKEGEKYFLEVNIPDGRKLSSNTQVPAKKPSEIKYKSIRTLYDSSEFFIDLSYDKEISWNDIPGEKNTYRALVYILRITKNSNDTTALQYAEFYKTDEIGDGSILTISSQIYAGYSTDTLSGDFPTFVGTIAFLIVGNDDYIKYHKDLTRNVVESNPFSEPTINFSNIKGGIGCFGAYLMDRKRL